MRSFSLNLLVVACCLVAAAAAAASTASAQANGNHLEEYDIEETLRPVASPARLGRNNRHYFVETCSQCPSNQCQVMGMQRYAEPFCDLLGGVGSPCRPWQEPENKTLHFPNKILQCNDVYMQFCPCSEGLVCEDAECRLPASQIPASNQQASGQPNDGSFYEYTVGENDVPSSGADQDNNYGTQEELIASFEAQQQQQQQARRYSRGPQWPQYSWFRFS